MEEQIKFLENLSDQLDRRMKTLSRGGEMQYGPIGEYMGVSHPKIKQEIHNAIKRLRGE